MNFKTSHVIVYQRLWITACKWIFYFKTSHVIVYHSKITLSGCNFNNFKTSHVIVYQDRLNWQHVTLIISKHLMLLFINVPSAKGGHVIIFQNISCYCLSLQAYPGCIDMTSFQNISCYCLSLAFPRF